MTEPTREAVRAADQAVALEALARHLRGQHLRALGSSNSLPWASLNTPEQRMWLERAQAKLAEDNP